MVWKLKALEKCTNCTFTTEAIEAFLLSSWEAAFGLSCIAINGNSGVMTLQENLSHWTWHLRHIDLLRPLNGTTMTTKIFHMNKQNIAQFVQLVIEQKVFSLSNWSVQAHAIQVLHYAYNVQIKKYSVIFELEGWFEEFFIFLPPLCFASIHNNLSLKPFWSHTFSHLCCNFLHGTKI